MDDLLAVADKVGMPRHVCSLVWKPDGTSEHPRTLQAELERCRVNIDMPFILAQAMPRNWSQIIGPLAICVDAHVKASEVHEQQCVMSYMLLAPCA